MRPRGRTHHSDSYRTDQDLGKTVSSEATWYRLNSGGAISKKGATGISHGTVSISRRTLNSFLA